MIIASDDGVYSYTNTISSTKYAIPVHKFVNNKRKSNTQGYQIKTQVGRNRIETVIDIIDSESNIRTNLLPQLEYPVQTDITFDENVPLRNTNQLKMTITEYEIDETIQDMDDGDLRIQLKLVEVIGV